MAITNMAIIVPKIIKSDTLVFRTTTISSIPILLLLSKRKFLGKITTPKKKSKSIKIEKVKTTSIEIIIIPKAILYIPTISPKPIT